MCCVICVVSYVHIMCAYHIHMLTAICSHVFFFCSYHLMLIHHKITHSSHFPYPILVIQYTVVTREVRYSRHIRTTIQSTRIRSLLKLSSQFDQVLNRIYPLPLPRSLMHLPLHVVMRSLVMKSNQH